LRMQFFTQCLPHGQGAGASSVGGPGVHHDLLATQAGQLEFVALEIR
jgi:hypothetical protein